MTVVVSPVVSQEFGVSVFEETSVVTYHSFCCLWKFAVFTFLLQPIIAFVKLLQNLLYSAALAHVNLFLLLFLFAISNLTSSTVTVSYMSTICLLLLLHSHCCMNISKSLPVSH